MTYFAVSLFVNEAESEQEHRGLFIANSIEQLEQALILYITKQTSLEEYTFDSISITGLASYASRDTVIALVATFYTNDEMIFNASKADIDLEGIEVDSELKSLVKSEVARAVNLDLHDILNTTGFIDFDETHVALESGYAVFQEDSDQIIDRDGLEYQIGSSDHPAIYSSLKSAQEVMKINQQNYDNLTVERVNFFYTRQPI